jgi:hypothetical protein
MQRAHSTVFAVLEEMGYGVTSETENAVAYDIVRGAAWHLPQFFAKDSDPLSEDDIREILAYSGFSVVAFFATLDAL